MNGFLNLLKPPGMTSFDAVSAVRRLLPRKTPVGHGGTLDPDAAGVLPVCIGKATRLFDYIVDKQKTYIAELCPGITTDTYDSSGRVTNVSKARLDPRLLEAALVNFTGEISQLPPVYSALKFGGEALYKKARRGEDVKLAPRSVYVEAISIRAQEPDGRFLLEIRCGKGTYIRSLVHDIGAYLGCGAHMSFLLRTRSGEFAIENAFTLDELKTSDDIENALVPMDMPLKRYCAAYYSKELRTSIINGQTLRPEHIDLPDTAAPQYVRIYAGSEFAGMGELGADGTVKIKAMLLERQI